MTVSKCCVSGIDRDDPKAAAIWQQLERVCDPELDEPITDMGFVEQIDVSNARWVAVQFRLPTYWCSANFAYLMASDIRTEVEKLEWVEEVKVKLADHMFEEQVSKGVSEGLLFHEIFADLAPDENLDAVREKFRKKAFQRRQEVMLLGLQELGLSNDKIVELTLLEFDAIDFTGEEERRQKSRYREIIGALGLARNPDDRVFCTYDGAPLQADKLKSYLSELRGVRINMEFGGALCRGLLSTRYKEFNADADEPTLVDFILDRVPPRQSEDEARQNKPITTAATD